MENTLNTETSPYLLQHRDNPVHWQPWGEEAFALARRLDRPVLLSVGYAACHWCHVMAHESFEDVATAELMNSLFVNVKVDREERPDVDRIYMDALHALGEQGGWPLTMFLTPERVPFWGGTYFPPESRYGRPSFRHVLTEISRIWTGERHKIKANAAALLDSLKHPPQPASAQALDDGFVLEAARRIAAAVDPVDGGLKGAPKFPQAPLFDFLWRAHLATGDRAFADPVVLTLTRISQGGIYDHVGGGIARYSVDGRWLVPHFEKMLYDNAQYVDLLASVWLATGEPLFRTRIEETVAWLLDAMLTGEGLFASSYDADSEGEEGRYYVWSYDELAKIVPESNRARFFPVYDVTPGGNWEGSVILNRLTAAGAYRSELELELAAVRDLLKSARSSRMPPGWDDKMLADWNGLAIKALTGAAVALGNDGWLRTARAAFDCALALLWQGDGLHHSYRAGRLGAPATADGYADLCDAGLALYDATLDPACIAAVRRLADTALRDYWADAGGFHLVPASADDLIVRPRIVHDDATPNANGIFVRVLAHLHHVTGEPRYLERAEAILSAFASDITRNPYAAPSALAGYLALSRPIEIVLVGRRADPALAELHRAALSVPLAHRAMFHVEPGATLPPGHTAAGHTSHTDGPVAMVCRARVCGLPLTDPDDLRAALAER